jgi:hypothetical protein
MLFFFSLTYPTNSQEKNEEDQSSVPTETPATAAATGTATGTTATANDTDDDDETVVVNQTDEGSSSSMSASAVALGGTTSDARHAAREVSNYSSTFTTLAQRDRCARLSHTRGSAATSMSSFVHCKLQ